MRALSLMVLMAAVSQPLAQAQDKKVGMTFTPEQARFADAAGEYRRIWADEGARMIDALERASGMQFPDMKIEVVIFEGPSISGRGSAPMKLRASYSADVKKGALVHELGHRLNARLRNRPKDLDEHRILFLYLYEAWEQLYGKDFADREVAFEKTLKGLYDYEAAWNWALSMTKEERASKLRELLNSNGGFGFRRF